MNKSWNYRLLNRDNCLSAPVIPQVWQCAGSPDQSAFFFAWGGPLSVLPGSDGDIPFGPDLDPSLERLRRLLRDPRKGSRSRAIDLGRLLGASWCTATEPGNEEDDAEFSVCRTALFDRGKRESDPGRYLDTSESPFLTLSTRKTFRHCNAALGDLATVIHAGTGRLIHAIVGDDRHIAGVEPSLYLAESLGLASDDSAIYLVHPGSGLGQGTIPTNDQIQSRGDRLFHRPPTGSNLSWPAILADCFVEILGDIEIGRELARDESWRSR